MRLPFLLLLFCSAACSAAVPPSSFSSRDPSSTSSTQTHITSASSKRPAITVYRPNHPNPKPSNSPQFHTRPPPKPGPLTRPLPRPTLNSPGPSSRPDRNDDSPDGDDDGQRHRRTQKPIVIFFEVLGGLVGLAILLSCARCCYIYTRTPKRDRIQLILERHRLERELEELERNPLSIRRTATNDPLPLYFPPPPTYETIGPRESTSGPAQHSDYREVSTTSPPSSRSTSPSTSPRLPTRQLESDPTEPMIPQPDIPPAPHR